MDKICWADLLLRLNIQKKIPERNQTMLKFLSAGLLSHPLPANRVGGRLGRRLASSLLTRSIPTPTNRHAHSHTHTNTHSHTHTLILTPTHPHTDTSSPAPSSPSLASEVSFTEQVSSFCSCLCFLRQSPSLLPPASCLLPPDPRPCRSAGSTRS